MSLTKESAKTILLSEIKRLYDIDIKDLDENLLSKRIGILTEDFLFLFAELNEKHRIDMYSILAQNDCEIFTVNSLADEIVNQQSA